MCGEVAVLTIRHRHDMHRATGTPDQIGGCAVLASRDEVYRLRIPVEGSTASRHRVRIVATGAEEPDVAFGKSTLVQDRTHRGLNRCRAKPERLPAASEILGGDR
jgi:hypothetical protein